MAEAIERGRNSREIRRQTEERRARRRETLGQAARIAGQAAPGFLLAFSDAMGVPSGLYAAYMTALAAAGECVAWPCAGAALSVVMQLIWGLAPRWGTLAACVALLFAPRVVFRSGTARLMLWTAAALAPEVIGRIALGTAQEALLSCATMAIGVLSAPVMLRAVRALTGERAIDSLEEQVSVGYLAAMLLCGGGRMMLFGVNVGVAGAALVTVCMALFLGVGAGSVAGMVSGVTLALQGLPLALSVALALGGFLAGMVQGLKRRGLSCLCFTMGCELVLLLCHASGGGGALAALVVPAAAALMRRGTAERLQSFFRRFHDSDAAAGDAYAAAALSAWERTVQAMAEAVPNPLENTETHDAAWWRSRLCDGCPDVEHCACMETERAARQMESVYAAREAEDEDWMRALDGLRGLGCGRLYHLRAQMDALRTESAASRAQSRKAMYQREMLVTHLTAMAGAVRRFSRLSVGESWWERLSARQLSVRAAELACPATLLYARQEEGHARVAWELHRMADAMSQAEDLRLLTEGALAAPMELVRVEDDRVYLTETPPLRVEAGVAGHGLMGDSHNGDAASLTTLADGRYMAALSDGMGHGEQAQAESGQTVTLLRLCLDAGYTRAQALTAVNGMMLLAGRGERFSTVDLFTCNLWSGEAALDKLGAAGSYLLRGDTLTALSGDALPLGILEDVEARSAMLRLKADDRLVLMTDGVEDAFPTRAALTDALRAALAQADATAAAQSLLESAARAAEQGHQDDRTAIVLQFLAASSGGECQE